MRPLVFTKETKERRSVCITCIAVTATTAIATADEADSTSATQSTQGVVSGVEPVEGITVHSEAILPGRGLSGRVGAARRPERRALRVQNIHGRVVSFCGLVQVLLQTCWEMVLGSRGI